MGNMLSSNEETLEDKLNAQLIRIVDEYKKMDLNMVYIALFKIKASQTSQQRHTSANPTTTTLPPSDSLISPASSTFGHPVPHGDSHSLNPGYPGTHHASQDLLGGNSQSHSVAADTPAHHQSATRQWYVLCGIPEYTDTLSLSLSLYIVFLQK